MISSRTSEGSQESIHPGTRIGRVCLESSRVGTLSAFYRRQLGLEEMGNRDGAVLLGAGHGVLLALEEVPEVRRQWRSAGLFHFALRLPDRIALAGAVRRLLDAGTVLEGFADHLVSEAAYLRDPEGNGIEVYRDRPRDDWFAEGRLRMDTLPLDVEELLSELPSAGVAASAPLPPQTVVGHVHLRVSDLEKTERFYTQILGLDLMTHFGSQAGFVNGSRYAAGVRFDSMYRIS